MVDNNLRMETHIHIEADASRIWDFLTLPERIRLWLFGTQTSGKWEPGEEILFELAGN